MSPGSRIWRARWALLAQTPQAIGLELHAHLERVALGLAPTASRRLDALGDPEEVLDVVAHLMGDDVGLSEVAWRADLVVQVTIPPPRRSRRPTVPRC